MDVLDQGRTNLGAVVAVVALPISKMFVPKSAKILQGPMYCNKSQHIDVSK